MNICRTKRNIFLLLLLLIGVEVSGQAVYKGELHISNEYFQRQGDLLHIYMKVGYVNTTIGSEESLTFTPMLRSNNNMIHLSSVLVNGSNKEKVEHRAEVLQHKYRNDVAVVVKEGQTDRRFFIYESTVPYQSWMNHSALCVETERCNCNGHRAQTYEDCVLSNIQILYAENKSFDSLFLNGAFLAWMQILKPEKQKSSNFMKTGIIKEKDLENMSHNQAVFDVLSSKIKNALQYYGTTLNKVDLIVYGAPIGNYKKNESQSMARVHSLKRDLIHSRLISKNLLDVNCIVEDWDSISSLTEGSNIEMKEVILNIIKSVDVANGREKILKNLHQGIPYEYMHANFFPNVSRITYKLSFSREDIDIQTGRLLLKEDPSTMSLSDLYTVAFSYKTGSSEFNDIIYLAVQFFPENPEANINAAAIALMQGHTALAHKYLLHWQTDPRAYNNLGVLYLLEGNRNKAEVYLKLALSSGVNPRIYNNLGILYLLKGNKDKAEIYLQIAQSAGVEQATTILQYIKSEK